MMIETVFSPCRKYRYTLWRDWPVELFDGREQGFVQFIGLNPSTADEVRNDPTCTRCINYIKQWGYSAYCMTNLFAFRATDPKVMFACAEPVGQDNDHWLVEVATKASLVICAWGAHGSHLNRSAKVMDLLVKAAGPKLRYLGLTNGGQPRHPLYLRQDLKPQPFSAALIRDLQFTTVGR